MDERRPPYRVVAISGLSRSKAVIEREINAAQVIDRARKEGRDHQSEHEGWNGTAA